jgi:hypothetical protein
MFKNTRVGVTTEDLEQWPHSIGVVATLLVVLAISYWSFPTSSQLSVKLAASSLGFLLFCTPQLSA